ncbi:MAG: bacillithiol biosynthesis cysteine-adding enzyme BshC [Ignavibacteria bacterium]|nr:bacillithiol biosynthesis cysteine-adding enzyme BshC [Ignavibacteria bacterium]
MFSIDFRELNANAEFFSHLFTTYLYNFSTVTKFFSGDFHSTESIIEKTNAIRFQQTEREILVNVLLEQASEFHSLEQSQKNIELLNDENTFAIVTGQQVGIFGGPLYTLYKAITTIKLASIFQEQYPDKNFVPVFWMEGEDHDLNEANNVTLINAEQKIESFRYFPGGIPSNEKHGAVGETIFDFFFNEMKSRLFQSLPQTEFTESVISLFSDCYRDGVSFNVAFARLLNALLGDSGIVFLYPNDKRLKHIVSNIYKKELQEYPRTSQLVIEQSAELEQQFEAQVKSRAINLFLLYHNGRYAIEPIENGFHLKGTHKYFSQQELFSLLEDAPEKFSPNVVLRPICQDTLLPTVAYVAGPSEIAYFAQFKFVYEYFNIPMPIIFPRTSVTLVEPRVARAMEKYNLRIADFFSKKDVLIQNVAQRISEFSAMEIFSETENVLQSQLERLQLQLSAIDTTLVAALGTAKNKILYQLTSLKERTLASQQKKYQSRLQQLEKSLHTIFPNESLQERELNVLYFLNKYGMQILEKLKEEIRIDVFEHQFLSV